MTLGGKIYQAPIKEQGNIQRVLDAGTGTGIWAMDMGMAKEYPLVDATVLTSFQATNSPKPR